MNIHTLHIPINRAIDGSSLGYITLNANKPPTATAAYACASKIAYSALPLYAGFFFTAPLCLGANVVAVFFANVERSFPTVVARAVVPRASSSPARARVVLRPVVGRPVGGPPRARARAIARRGVGVRGVVVVVAIVARARVRGVDGDGT